MYRCCLVALLLTGALPAQEPVAVSLFPQHRPQALEVQTQEPVGFWVEGTLGGFPAQRLNCRTIDVELSCSTDENLTVGQSVRIGTRSGGPARLSLRVAGQPVREVRGVIELRWRPIFLEVRLLVPWRELAAVLSGW